MRIIVVVVIVIIIIVVVIVVVVVGGGVCRPRRVGCSACGRRVAHAPQQLQPASCSCGPHRRPRRCLRIGHLRLASAIRNHSTTTIAATTTNSDADIDIDVNIDFLVHTACFVDTLIHLIINMDSASNHVRGARSESARHAGRLHRLGRRVDPLRRR
jgi:hypothetical protein